MSASQLSSPCTSQREHRDRKVTRSLGLLRCCVRAFRCVEGPPDYLKASGVYLEDGFYQFRWSGFATKFGVWFSIEQKEVRELDFVGLAVDRRKRRLVKPFRVWRLYIWASKPFKVVFRGTLCGCWFGACAIST